MQVTFQLRKVDIPRGCDGSLLPSHFVIRKAHGRLKLVPVEKFNRAGKGKKLVSCLDTDIGSKHVNIYYAEKVHKQKF